MQLPALDLWIAIIGTVVVGCAVYATLRRTQVPYSLFAVSICFFAVAAWMQSPGGSPNGTTAELEKRLMGLRSQTQDLAQSLKAMGVTVDEMNDSARQSISETDIPAIRKDVENLEASVEELANMMTAAGGESTIQTPYMTKEQRADRIRDLRQELIRLTREIDQQN
jgi:5-enolpyruvylshikimate-3-phosphate synthase